MRRIAFAIEKGGTGKTTSAVHVACALAAMGRNVLLVDTDTQDQCAAHLGEPQFKPGLAEIILGESTPKECIIQARERLFLLPAGEKLAGVKMRLPEIAQRARTAPEKVLETALSFTASGTLDYVIIDSAPGTDAFLVNVMHYASLIVVPVPPEMMAIRGMMRFFRTAKLLGKSNLFILPTLHDRRVAKTARIMAKLKKHFESRLLEKVSYAACISEAAGAGMTVFEYAPRHPSAKEYTALAKYLDKRKEFFAG